MRNPIPHARGFTLVELLVVLAAVGVLMVVFPVVMAIGNPYPRVGHSIMKESVNLRNIHAAMATYAATNKDYFPGLTNQGHYTTQKFQGEYYGALPNARNEEEAKNGAGCPLSTGTHLALAQLLEEGLVTPAMLISPGETSITSRGLADPQVMEVLPDTVPNQRVNPAGGSPVPPLNGEVKTHHFSYAMLAYGRASLKPEWKANQNQLSVVLGTRLIFGDRPTAFSSTWTDDGSGKWKGTVVRNDSSTSVETFSAGHVAENFGILKYGDLRLKVAVESDAAIGAFGRSTDMANFDATEKTGMIGCGLD